MIDDLLRQKQGIDLPIYIVHGAHDHIFRVESIRQGHKLLTRIGYNATYEELPDWGHAYTSSIHEQLVLPWFESIGDRPVMAHLRGAEAIPANYTGAARSGRCSIIAARV